MVRTLALLLAFEGSALAWSMDAGGPYTVAAEGSVVLNGSDSDDCFGFVDSYDYHWDFTSDGTWDTSYSTSTSTTYTATNIDGPATLTVTLEVRCNKIIDDYKSDTATLTVANVAPTIDSIDGGTTIDEGTEGTWLLKYSDVEPADTHTVDWDFTDGTQLTNTNPATHSFANNGSYDVVVTVTDDDQAATAKAFNVTVNNVSPTIDSFDISIGGDEGQPLDFSATASDPGADTLTYSWDFGNGQQAEGSAVSYSYPDPGSYTVTLTVSDGDGGEVSQSDTVLINNLSPSAGSLSAIDVDEGSAQVLSASASDPGGGLLNYLWDFGTGDTSTLAAPSYTFADNGSYLVQLTVVDSAGVIDTSSTTVNVANVAPTVVLNGDLNDSVTASLSWSTAITDPGTLDTHTYDWDFGDGDTLADGGPTVSHSFYSNGNFTVQVTVTDDDGGQGVDSLGITINNAGPALDALSGDLLGDEGASLAWTCAGSDRQSTGSLVYSWDFGDGSLAGDLTSVIHSFNDNGSYLVRCTVTDGEGHRAFQQLTVEVSNVAPTILGSPPLMVAKGNDYIFAPSFSDPGVDDTLTWSRVSAPVGSAVSTLDGRVSWKATVSGSYDFAIQLTDNDGGSDTLAWTVEVTGVDSDGDGMSDSWELLYNLDPADASDGALDPDGDGRSNLDEFLAGTDPTVPEGPSTPVLESPGDGGVVASLWPELVVLNASSGAGDALSYDFQLLDQTGVELSSVSGVVEGAGTTRWLVDIELVENTRYQWTATATDAYQQAPWAVPFSFLVDTLNDPPTAPAIASPSDLSTVASLFPDLVFDPATDPEGQPLSYTFVVEDTLGVEATRESGVADIRWTIDWPLVDGDTYCWWGFAVDDLGLQGPDSNRACFTVDESNLPPSAPVALYPDDLGTVSDLRPVITVANGVDPEGMPTTHAFEIATDIGFSVDLQQHTVLTNPSGTTTWQPGTLAEDVVHYVRARASDGVSQSEWVQWSFLVDTTNSPPSVPEPLAPSSGDAFAAGDRLKVRNSTDPEGEDIVYDFVVLDARGDQTWSASSVPEGTGSTSVVPPQLDVGVYSWSAQAIDSQGNASGWSSDLPFEVKGVDPDGEPSGRTPQTSPTDVKGAPNGCACQAGAGGSMGWVGGLLVLALMRRRQP